MRNVTVIGTPTITNGVVSGFSTSNYLMIPSVVPLATADSWEKVVKFTYKTTGSNIQAFITTTNDGGGSEEYIGASTVLFYRTSNDTSSMLFTITGSTLLVDGNTYWGKIEFTGDTYNLYLSTTGKFNGEETLEASYSSTTKCLSRNHYIGNTLISNYNYIATSFIDLNESYIKINGELWWTGKEFNLYALKYRKQKYYKKIVVIEGDTYEAFYFSDHRVHYYIKTPYKVGDIIYDTNGRNFATSVDQLYANHTITSINADGTINGTGNFTLTNMTHNPKYDLTTAVTELVESTKDDYDVVENLGESYHNLKAKTNTYFLKRRK